MRKRKVTVLLTRPNKFKLFSWLIRLVQNTDFSHMAICYGGARGGSVVLDASGSTVRIMGLERFLESNMIVGGINLGYIHPKDFRNFYMPQLGKKYDFKSIIGLLLKSLGFISSNKMGSNYKKLICSELVVLFVQRFYNIPIGDSDNYGLNETRKVLSDICKR